MSLTEIYDHVCGKCPLSMTANTICVEGIGNISNHLMIIGEAPGAEEDHLGIPFVGRSGKLLDRFLLNAGLPRTEVFVTNIVKCRPPNNRAPDKEEVDSCIDYLYEECMRIKPLQILLLGSSALKWGLGKEGITNRRGKWVTEETDWGRCKFLPTFHPSYVLRFPIKEIEFEQDINEFVYNYRRMKRLPPRA